MSNQNTTDDSESAEDEEHEVEHVVTRAEGAAALHRLADAVAEGSVTLEDDVTTSIPERFEFEIEYEEEDEEAELEAELEWPVDGDDGEALEQEPTDPEETQFVEAPETASKARFELYRDNADEWRWRMVHDNGNIIADSGEGYGRKATARNGLESVMRNAQGANIVVRED